MITPAHLAILLLICLAAIASAVMDTVAFHQGGVLKRKFGDFFDINKQGKFLPFTKYPFDAFHVSKSLMIFSYIGAISIIITPAILAAAIFVIGGIDYNFVFNLFWNKIFKPKPPKS